jgi:hypothetical protein
MVEGIGILPAIVLSALAGGMSNADDTTNAANTAIGNFIVNVLLAVIYAVTGQRPWTAAPKRAQCAVVLLSLACCS